MRTLGRRRSAVLGALALLFAALPLTSSVAAAAQPTLVVGSMTLKPCQGVPDAWCGSLPVPLDYQDPTGPKLGITFEWYPAGGSGPVQGTIMAVEGGPGYPSRGTRDYYLELFDPLLRSRNLLLVDLRGTGTSAVVKCRPLQNFATGEPNDRYVKLVGDCGEQLDRTWRRSDGTWARGSQAFTTANSARDVAAVLTALRTGKIDLYGDSYGTYFGQTFTARYPSMLRSVTLDAAYPVLGADPWYPDTIDAARTAFNDACSRSVACDAAASGSAFNRIGALAARLRTAPVTGLTRLANGKLVRQTVDVDTLVSMVNLAASDFGVYHDLDATTRALLRRDDAAPLLRLAAQTVLLEDSGPVADFSAGLYAAVTCSDYAQLYDLGASEATRRAQYDAAVAALPANTFAPFTVTEWSTSMVSEFDACVQWPAPQNTDPPIVTAPPLAPANLPVLVLSSSMDSLTPPADGQRVAAQMGPSARWVLVQNLTHVSALGDFYACGSVLVQEFVRRPQQLDDLDASCARHVPEIRAVGEFPKTFAQANLATAEPGHRAGPIGRRLAQVASDTIGDALVRWWYIPGTKGHGLRGGTFTAIGSDDVALTFKKLKLVDDAAVSGTGTWNVNTGDVAVDVTVTGPGGVSATLHMTWNDLAAHATSMITGTTSDGKPVRASTPAF